MTNSVVGKPSYTEFAIGRRAPCMSVRQMARHGKALAGLLKRYFNK